jgi:hypothetical protein
MKASYISGQSTHLLLELIQASDKLAQQGLFGGGGYCCLLCIRDSRA